jgi:hypothetical protein
MNLDQKGRALWPAAGSEDTEIGCFEEPEVSDATTKFSREFRLRL